MSGTATGFGVRGGAKPISSAQPTLATTHLLSGQFSLLLDLRLQSFDLQGQGLVIMLEFRSMLATAESSSYLQALVSREEASSGSFSIIPAIREETFIFPLRESLHTTDILLMSATSRGALSAAALKTAQPCNSRLKRSASSSSIENSSDLRFPKLRFVSNSSIENSSALQFQSRDLHPTAALRTAQPCNTRVVIPFQQQPKNSSVLRFQTALRRAQTCNFRVEICIKLSSIENNSALQFLSRNLLKEQPKNSSALQFGVEICIKLSSIEDSSALKFPSRDLLPTASSVEDYRSELWFKPVLISVGSGEVSGAHLRRIGLCILRAKWTVIASNKNQVTRSCPWGWVLGDEQSGPFRTFERVSPIGSVWYRMGDPELPLGLGLGGRAKCGPCLAMDQSMFRNVDPAWLWIRACLEMWTLLGYGSEPAWKCGPCLANGSEHVWKCGPCLAMDQRMYGNVDSAWLWIRACMEIWSLFDYKGMCGNVDRVGYQRMSGNADAVCLSEYYTNSPSLLVRTFFLTTCLLAHYEFFSYWTLTSSNNSHNGRDLPWYCCLSASGTNMESLLSAKKREPAASTHAGAVPAAAAVPGNIWRIGLTKCGDSVVVDCLEVLLVTVSPDAEYVDCVFLPQCSTSLEYWTKAMDQAVQTWMTRVAEVDLLDNCCMQGKDCRVEMVRLQADSSINHEHGFKTFESSTVVITYINVGNHYLFRHTILPLLLLNHLTILHLQLKREEMGCDFIHDFACSACEEDGLNTEAQHFCNQCTKYYCNNCVPVHNKLYKRHAVLDRKDVKKWAAAPGTVEVLEICERHPGEALKLVCGDHDQLCCHMCVAVDHRLILPHTVVAGPLFQPM
ncbi:hypothetical protein MAR_011616 [Mya arenaria]|uniref:B box-type domain-containing protein n=1 Tax=Mya arenaria TaxID=6604 RepID=A0ABY7FUU6_MYAAR|nr:hypothetical protein MAR_011616 [Mya arenaria]